jgi:hypothetical protein
MGSSGKVPGERSTPPYHPIGRNVASPHFATHHRILPPGINTAFVLFSLASLLFRVYLLTIETTVSVEMRSLGPLKEPVFMILSVGKKNRGGFAKTEYCDLGALLGVLRDEYAIL